METTIIILKVYGIISAVAGLSLLLFPANAEKLIKDIAKTPAFYFLAGMLSLIIGAIIVVVHNDWSGGWPLVATLLGWIAIVKGFVLMAMPSEVAEMEKKKISSKNAVLGWGLLAFAIGAFLIWKAYFCL